MKILIGIPTIRFYSPFWHSMAYFIPQVKTKHEVEIIEVRDKPIAEARTEIVDYMMSKDFDALLFLDDDHSGHTLEMLDSLINSNEYIIGIKCYWKVFPHYSNLADYTGREDIAEKYTPKDFGAGVYPCDLVGFGMTLIKRQVFLVIDKPYFVSINNCREDNYFCDKVIEKGIRPAGCFDYVLDHCGINELNSKELRDKGMQVLIETIKRQDPNFNPNNMTMVV